MRRLNHKVRAFSLIEILVVLILSSIVVSIIYMGYYNITTYQANLLRKQQRLENISRLYFLLRKDIGRSEFVFATSDSALGCRLAGGDYISYSFESVIVTRTQNSITDTFFCKTRNQEFFWQTKRIVAFPSKADELNFVLELNEPVSLSLFKDYDASSLIDTKTDSIP
jgi:prepilin-type N-terminal cleavage/methylation domain-containing protein